MKFQSEARDMLKFSGFAGLYYLIFTTAGWFQANVVMIVCGSILFVGMLLWFVWSAINLRRRQQDNLSTSTQPK